MKILENEKLYLVYIGVSFADDRVLYDKVKKVSRSVVVPYYDIEGISYASRQSLANYVLADKEDVEGIVKVVLSIHKGCEVERLGQVKDYKLLDFVRKVRQDSHREVIPGKIYQITEGEYKNLIVRVESVNGDVVSVKYPFFGKIRTLDVNISSLERFKDLYKLKKQKNFKSYIDPRKHIIIDGRNILYRSIFAYPDKYSMNGDYIGAGYGFYFALLKLKTLFAEYVPHICFDFSKNNKQSEYPRYCKLQIRGGDEFAEIFEKNLQWCSRLCDSLGYPTYRAEGIDTDCLVANLTRELLSNGAEDILLYSQDEDFVQLLSGRVRIYQPRQSLKQPDRMVTREDILGQYGIDRIDKIIWYRSVYGDISGRPTPITNLYKDLRQNCNSVTDRADCVRYVNMSDSIGRFKGRLLSDVRYKSFVESGCFDRNYHLLKLDDSCLKDYVLYRGYDPEKVNKRVFVDTMKEFCMYRELEFIDRNFRIFRGVW